jgi:hypothetical protein
MAHLSAFEFLKRRYASAIERADDRTATRLRAEIDELIRQPAADAVAGGRSSRSAELAWLRPWEEHDDILEPHLGAGPRAPS